jgi:hypothetical protein
MFRPPAANHADAEQEASRVGIVQQVYEPFGHLCFQPGFCLPGNEQPGFEGDPRAEEPCHLVLKKAAAHLSKNKRAAD